ncbi:NAD(P)-binding protein [Delitschia confertaspora ATCC 74209]|uniref:NAD(P)-binding protein n=1 Tax=Delitschia confertaspora ATCC 74209 TaxID=1513339 RepID=A0A9P4JSZ6_9PLEO|nr:NAD(P)-binding protein [Delitschia confertaspora ATCC 74209]
MSEKVIILTGASRGIGLAIANYLLSKNSKLVITARSKDALEQLRSSHPEQVEVITGDMSDPASYNHLATQAVEAATKRWGRVDALVVNHGVLDPVKKVADAEAQEWRTGFEVNVFSAVALIRAALPSLRTSRGRIILTSSGAATHAYTAWGCYGATKAALNHLAMTLAVEEPEVTTVSIRPGVVATEMQKEIREKHDMAMGEETSRKFKELKEEGKLLKPEQPGNVIARLALDAEKGLSGRFLSWDDGEALGGYQEG